MVFYYDQKAGRGNVVESRNELYNYAVNDAN